MNTMLVSNDVMLQMLKLSEFQNPLTGLNFRAPARSPRRWARSCCAPPPFRGQADRSRPKLCPRAHLRQRGDGGVRQSSSTARSSARRSRAFRALPNTYQGGPQGADRLTTAGSERREERWTRRSLRRRRASAPAARRMKALLKRLCAASAQALERELREALRRKDCEGRVHLRERMAGCRRADGRKGSAGRRSCPPSARAT